jgi:hypothetical protein
LGTILGRRFRKVRLFHRRLLIGRIIRLLSVLRLRSRRIIVSRIAGFIRIAGIIRVTGFTRIAGITRVTGIIRVTGIARIAGITRVTGIAGVTGERRIFRIQGRLQRILRVYRLLVVPVRRRVDPDLQLYQAEIDTHFQTGFFIRILRLRRVGKSDRRREKGGAEKQGKGSEQRFLFQPLNDLLAL